MTDTSLGGSRAQKVGLAVQSRQTEFTDFQGSRGSQCIGLRVARLLIRPECSALLKFTSAAPSLRDLKSG